MLVLIEWVKTFHDHGFGKEEIFFEYQWLLVLLSTIPFPVRDQ
jgi:hypothetical protein